MPIFKPSLFLVFVMDGHLTIHFVCRFMSSEYPHCAPYRIASREAGWWVVRQIESNKGLKRFAEQIVETILNSDLPELMTPLDHQLKKNGFVVRQ